MVLICAGIFKKIVLARVNCSHATMPRVKRKGVQSSKERELAIKAAKAAVQAGKSIRSAAREFGVPNTTLQTHCSK